MSLNLVTAILLAAGAFALALRQIVLSPRNVSFPCAPQSVRFAMFLLVAFMIYGAMKFVGAGGAQPYAGQAGTVVAVLAGVHALYQGLMLLNVLGQRRPAKVWARLRRYEVAAMSAPGR